MTTLNSFLATLNGPACLRAALRQKTVAISRLLVALDSPGELRVQIPAAVFGGDIFGVMSQQLRDALIVPPPPAPGTSRSRRKQLLPTVEDSLAKHPKNPSQLADRVKRSSLINETPAKTSLPQTASFRNSEGVSSESLAVVADPIKENRSVLPAAVEAAVAAQLNAIASPFSPAASLSSKKLAATTDLANASALVNSLNRYWQLAREPKNAAETEKSGVATVPSHVSHKLKASEAAEVDQQPASNSWPNALARESFARRTFSNDRLHSPTERAPKLEAFPSFAERAVHPDFNFQPTSNLGPHYDDLGERLAEILQEQALQHGIDIT
jgi:hypothetical protein